MNNKPDWKDAPAWAQWLACDYDGNWYWYEEKPDNVNHEYCWSMRDGSIFEYAGCTNGVICRNWKETLEKRT